MEDMGNVCPFVQISVTQTVDKATGALRILDLLVADQVIYVPTISSSSCPSRAVPLQPQVAEQLMEVPTVLSPALLQQQTVVQPVDIPFPRGRSGRRLQGSPSRQSSH